MVACINRGVGAFERLGTGAFLASDRLRPEQNSAIDFVLNCRDRAVSICGAAGAGKTATLQELRRGLEEAGHRVVPLAPTMSAVEELQRVGFSAAVTLERVLRDQQMQGSLTGGSSSSTKREWSPGDRWRSYCSLWSEATLAPTCCRGTSSCMPKAATTRFTWCSRH